MKRRFLLLFLMLIISALVATGAAYAWFNIATFASYQSSLIQANATGTLKIYISTADEETYPRVFENYVNSIDFANEESPFYDRNIIRYNMTDQSGDGKIFYKVNKENSNKGYVSLFGVGRALCLDIWLSAYDGLEDVNYDKDIYLTNESVMTGDVEISSAVRVAFIKDDNILGVWAPNANQNNLVFVTPADYPGQYPAASGAIKETPEPGEIKLIRSGNHVSATSIFHIDSSRFDVEGLDKLTAVIWFEGTDVNCVDAYLGQTVKISFVFAVRNVVN